MNDLTILWLDDKREPYKYFAKIAKDKEKNKPISGAGMRNSTFYDNNIFNKYNVTFDWVKNLDEFSNYIQRNGIPQFVSFDRDLTPKGWKQTHNEPFPDGIACAKWLKQYCQETNQQMPRCFVHSANTKQIPELEKELGDAAYQQALQEQHLRLIEKKIYKMVKQCLIESIR